MENQSLGPHLLNMSIMVLCCALEKKDEYDVNSILKKFIVHRVLLSGEPSLRQSTISKKEFVVCILQGRSQNPLKCKLLSFPFLSAFFSLVLRPQTQENKTKTILSLLTHSPSPLTGYKYQSPKLVSNKSFALVSMHHFSLTMQSEERMMVYADLLVPSVFQVVHIPRAGIPNTVLSITAQTQALENSTPY